MLLVPVFLYRLAHHRGIESKSHQQLWVCDAYFAFYSINFFFFSLVAGSLFTALEQILDHPTSLPTLLGQAIPIQAVYFVNLIIMRAFSVFPLNLANIGNCSLHICSYAIALLLHFIAVA